MEIYGETPKVKQEGIYEVRIMTSLVVKSIELYWKFVVILQWKFYNIV